MGSLDQFIDKQVARGSAYFAREDASAALDLKPGTLAAAFHGSSHQAAMVFQVVVPKLLRDFEVGRHRLQFLYQAPQAFARVNQPDLLGQEKSDAGYAKVAGVELTPLDCVRYFHKAINNNQRLRRSAHHCASV